MKYFIQWGLGIGDLAQSQIPSQKYQIYHYMNLYNSKLILY